MFYQVLDNNKPADYKHHKVSHCWKQSTYSNFNDALMYARKWLGLALGGSYDGKTGITLEPNQPYDYSGYGDTIEIREIGGSDMTAKFITVQKQRKKIVEVIDTVPADRNVGIFYGAMYVRTTDNKTYELCSDGKIYPYNEKTNQTSKKAVGIHNLYTEY